MTFQWLFCNKLDNWLVFFCVKSNDPTPTLIHNCIQPLEHTMFWSKLQLYQVKIRFMAKNTQTLEPVIAKNLNPKPRVLVYCMLFHNLSQKTIFMDLVENSFAMHRNLKSCQCSNQHQGLVHSSHIPWFIQLLFLLSFLSNILSYSIRSPHNNGCLSGFWSRICCLSDVTD